MNEGSANYTEREWFERTANAEAWALDNQPPPDRRMIETESQVNIIRGKMLVGHATKTEIQDFLTYAAKLEGLLDDGDNQDAFGTEGWRKHIFKQ